MIDRLDDEGGAVGAAGMDAQRAAAAGLRRDAETAARPARRARRSVLASGARALALAAMAVAVAGCAGWFGRPKAQAPLPELPAPAGGASVRPAWSLSLGRAGVGLAPAVVGNSVWAAGSGGTVARIDVASGKVFWRVDLGRPISAGVGTDGQSAVVVSREGEVIALDGEGRERWRAQIGTEVTTVPAVALGTVLVRGADNRVVALDLEDGRRKWAVARPNPPLVLRQTAAIAIAPDVAYVGMPGGRLAALSLASGAPRWEIAVAQPRGASEIERIADVVGSPLVSGREVCAATYQGRIGCFDAAGGNQLWAREFSSSSGLEVDARYVFAADADSNLHAFSRTGSSVWKQDKLARRGLTAPLSVGDAVAVGDRLGLLHFVARDSGSLMARVSTDGSAIVAPPVAAESTVVVQTAAGGLFAFRTE